MTAMPFVTPLWRGTCLPGARMEKKAVCSAGIPSSIAVVFGHRLQLSADLKPNPYRTNVFHMSSGEILYWSRDTSWNRGMLSR